MMKYLLPRLLLWTCIIACFSNTQAEQCTDRFMDLSLVNLRGGRIGVNREGTRMDNEIRIITSIQFTCTAQIDSVILGIDIRRPEGNRNLYPSLQLWRPTDEDDDDIQLVLDSERIIVYTPANVSSTGIHEYPLVPPLNANPGDYLAISQPMSDDNRGGDRSIVRVYTVDRGSGSSFIANLGSERIDLDLDSDSLDRRLVLVYPITDQSNCVNSALAASDVRSRSLLISETKSVDDERQFLYPDMKFMCNGTIHKWIYSGISNPSETELPELQVWRQTSDGNYNKQGSRKVSASGVNISLNVYELIVVPPIEFMEGDIFGLHQPKMGDSGFILYEQEHSGPGNSIFDSGGGPGSANAEDALDMIDSGDLDERKENDFPLVALEISVIASSSTTQSISIPSTLTTVSSVNSITDTVTVATAFVSTTTTTRIDDIRTTGINFISSTIPNIGTPPVQPVPSLLTPLITVTSSLGVNETTANNTSNLSTNDFNESTFIGAIVAVVLLIITIIVCTAIVVTVLIWRRNVERNNGGASTSAGADKLTGYNEEQSLSNPIYRANTASVMKNRYKDVTIQSPLPPQIAAGGLTASNRPALAVPPPLINDSPGNAVYSEINEERRLYHFNGGQQQQYDIVVPTLDQRRMINSNFKDFREAISSIYAKAESTSVSGPYDSNYQFLESESSKFFEESNIYWAPGSDYGSLYEQLASRKFREILSSQIGMSTMLGSGNFGVVMKGTWNSPSYGGPLPVAIKTVKQNALEEEKIKFLQEAAIMGQFHHPNIVHIYGVVTMSDPAMIVLELMHDGDLENFLKDLRPSPGEMVAPSVPELLLGFCRQVASAMEYLANKSFIHRDLAARNVLVTDRKICKISDFGLSRDLQEETYYISKGGQIPIKWTAPEALSYKKYSTASDVWSYGVLMYEIWSLGEKPFQSVTNQQAFRKVCDGYRLPPPPGCPRPLYQIMIECWNPDNGLRPSFSSLVVQLSQNDVKLLEVCLSSASSGVHPQASILGGAIEAGEELYPDLQNIYRNN